MLDRLVMVYAVLLVMTPARGQAQFVPVAAAGNAASPACACGAVDHEFAMYAHEVTNLEYSAFLSCVARDADPFGLFSPVMQDHFWGGIARTRCGSSYVYAAKPGYADLPVTLVSWVAAARMANWLQYGAPCGGRSELGTTEGNAERGAYDTRAEDATAIAAITRSARAAYFLPTRDEWIKAGFFDPVSKRFRRYATGDSAPVAGPPATLPAGANFYRQRWAAPFPHLTPVGSYVGSRSSFGTYDQAGNVVEWTEDRAGAGKLMIGGSLLMDANALDIAYVDSEIATQRLSSLGFRLARLAPTALAASSEVYAEAELPRQLPQAACVPSVLPASALMAPLPAARSEYVRIDEPGNLFDYRTGRGCVPYEYELMRTEITNEAWARFLSVVARHADPHGLYRPDSSDGVGGGIVRYELSDCFEYRAKPDFEQRPATYLSFLALARYANWLHRGAPDIAAESLETTEGSDRSGAYDTRNLEPLMAATRLAADTRALLRNPDARYFIPSDDEWYKAAYFDPARPGLDKYWAYPTRSDVAPPNVGPGGANYQTELLGEGAPFYVSVVGRYGYEGYYELADLAGNVWEWTEDWKNLGPDDCWRCDRPSKGLRGGSYNYSAVGLEAMNRDPGRPDEAFFTYGGRLARAVAGGAQARCLPGGQAFVGARRALARPWLRGLLVVGALGAAASVLMLMVRRKRRRRATAV